MPTQVEQILEEFGEKLVTDVRAKLRAKGVVFGPQDSKLAAKTEFEVGAKDSGIALDFIMPEEWYWVNYGRKPGPVSKEGRNSLANYVTRKGIVGNFIAKDLQRRQDLQKERKANSSRKPKKLKRLSFKKGVEALTFLKAQAITKYGYKPTHFFDEVLNDGRQDKLRKDLEEAGQRDIVLKLKIN